MLCPVLYNECPSVQDYYTGLSIKNYNSCLTIEWLGERVEEYNLLFRFLLRTFICLWRRTAVGLGTGLAWTGHDRTICILMFLWTQNQLCHKLLEIGFVIVRYKS